MIQETPRILAGVYLGEMTMTDTIEIDDAPFGWDSPFAEERAGFLETDSRENFCGSVRDLEDEEDLAEIMARMSAASTVALYKGETADLMSAIKDYDELMWEIGYLPPEIIHSTLLTVRAIAQNVGQAAYYRCGMDYDECDGMCRKLDEAIDKIAAVAKDLNRFAWHVTQQAELDRKRALYRRRPA